MKRENKKLIAAELIGVFVVFGLAVLFHFLYDWSGRNYIVGLFTATNESVFEHIKILFFPYILYSIVEFFIIKPSAWEYFAVKALTAAILPVVLVIGFYTYTGIIGKNIMLVDVLSTLVYIAVAFYVSYLLLSKKADISKVAFLSYVIFIVVLFFIIMWSTFPPKIALFYDFQNNLYGMR